MKRDDVIRAVGATQDGGTLLTPGDKYSIFLIECIDGNTNAQMEVDMEEVASNIKYMIHELNKALTVFEK